MPAIRGPHDRRHSRLLQETAGWAPRKGKALERDSYRGTESPHSPGGNLPTGPVHAERTASSSVG